MPKKKQPRNAFFFFMLDYKTRCERNGERFPNGLRDVQIEAGPEWDVLPPAEKKRYEDMAKEEKAKVKGDVSHKETNMHRSFAVVDREKAEEERKKHEMLTYIENKVASLMTEHKIAEYKFYLIHVNYFCISEGDCYHPAELAISEFSLGSGVTNVYHTIIDPGQIPLGYRHEAMQKSDCTHKIAAEGNGGERDFYKIIREIRQFIQPGRVAEGGELPPLYTMPDNVNLNTSISAVKSVIDNLLNSDPEYDGSERYCFRIYSLEHLFKELRNACSRSNGEEDMNIGVAQIELEKDVFNYTPNIACPFHFKEDAVEYCSKSYVQRWVFLICDHCCEFLNITLITGQHIPENADVNFRQKQLDAERNIEPPKPFTFIDHSKRQQPTTSWVPVEQPPLPRPRVKANLSAMLPPMPPEPERPVVTDEDFPAMPIGRGRGRIARGGGSRGNTPLSFAEAMRNNK